MMNSLHVYIYLVFFPEWCTGHTLSDVGDSITHRWVASWTYGAWFKDPYPRTEADKTRIIHIIYGNHQYFTISNNYTDFITGRNPTNSHKGYVTGLGQVAYNGSFYFFYGNKIFKYDVSTKQTTSNTLVKSNINYLKSTVATYIDIKVDENDLWAVYTKTDTLDKLVISRINPRNLAVEKTWLTNKGKTGVCATFMVCGKLYAIDTCTSRVAPGSHHEQYVYDTVTSQESYIPLHVTSKYGHIWELTYNPRERMLFGWDQGHMVTYPLLWNSQETETK